MTVRRAAPALVAIAAMTLCGCRAMNYDQVGAKPVMPVPTLAVAEVIDQHNRNAELVQSLEARPSISDRRIGAAQGRMALVRPRDFKLTLSTPTRGVLADLGSNDEEFWIWSSQAEEKAIYVGRYDTRGEVPPDLAFQPDWVVEALGLRVIPPEEVRSLTTRPGDAAGSLVIVHKRPGNDGATQVKETIVDRASGRILEHDFYAPDGKTLLARAIPSEYEALQLESGESVQLPNRIRLVVQAPEQEPITYAIVMGISSTRLNQFDPARRTAIFTRPDYEGYAVVDLNQRLGTASPAPAVTYETLPSPDSTRVSDSAVRLSEPAPLGPEPTARAADPVPLAADLPGSEPGAIDAVVGFRIPRPPLATDDTGTVTRTGGIGFGSQ